MFRVVTARKDHWCVSCAGKIKAGSECLQHGLGRPDDNGKRQIEFECRSCTDLGAPADNMPGQ